MTTHTHAAPWTFRRFLACVIDRFTNPAPDLRTLAPLISREDVLVTLHWGYTPAQWAALDNSIRTAKRSGYYQAVGLGA